MGLIQAGPIFSVITLLTRSDPGEAGTSPRVQIVTIGVVVSCRSPGSSQSYGELYQSKGLGFWAKCVQAVSLASASYIPKSVMPSASPITQSILPLKSVWGESRYDTSNLYSTLCVGVIAKFRERIPAGIPRLLGWSKNNCLSTESNTFLQLA